jgi:hypothetical protein
MLKRYLVFFGDDCYPSGGMEDFKNDFENLDNAYCCVADLFKETTPSSYRKNNPKWLNEWDESYMWAHIYDSLTKTLIWKSDDQGHLFNEVMKTVNGYKF